MIMAQDCVPGPVSLPIVNVTLATGKTRRGIAVNVGQPSSNLPSYPNGTITTLSCYDPQNIIGLGSASSLINALRKAGHIMSSAVGFYWGLDGVNDRDQRPGALVLGGYDKAKTYGDGYTAFLTDTRDCESGMTVPLRDIVLNFANGTNASIFPRENGGTVLRACLLPERPVIMDMPRTPYFKNLLAGIGNLEYSRSASIDWWSVILDPRLPIGLQIKILNHQLIVPERCIEAGGEISVNDSRPAIRINSLQVTTANYIPVLGRYFLTSAYLMANRGANQFTLWEANPTSEENLVAVNDKNEVFPATAKEVCARQPTASLQPERGSSSNGGGSGASITPGAVAGIAVGAAAALLAAAALIWWLLGRKRKGKTTQSEPNFQNGRDLSQSPKQNLGYPSQGFPHFIPQEISSEPMKHQPTEMPALIEDDLGYTVYYMYVLFLHRSLGQVSFYSEAT
ncbi:peptidase aspartic [Hirsutella rhossiliensis]|uniref:Peptidase aspartic n=1 Tax=Hirsutella rhossiliensis TaxID=111463 RepID=A0A9P8SHP1_9HYPO|nr:Peptidase aspartic [Hirsutella rhossiliensis]KAH0961760.1 Peptidase aspartic [Hirsutella rhossiliensis]